jgi:hypothetical protein
VRDLRPFEFSHPFEAFEFRQTKDNKVKVEFNREKFFEIFYLLQNIKSFCAANLE